MALTLRVEEGGEHAEACRNELRIPREVVWDLGRSALGAIRSGRYEHSGDATDGSEAVEQAIAFERSLPSDAELPATSESKASELIIEVTDETTMAGARQLVDAGKRPLAV